jgi:hypothetical protein
VASPPTTWAQGESKTFDVTLTNTGNIAWPSSGTNPVRLGIHFTAQAGSCCTWFTDQRFNLPHDIAIGETVTVSVTVTAPAIRGQIDLELRLEKEGTFWFDDYNETFVSVGF